MQDTFETIAEIAVALTGFAGIVAILGHRGRQDWSPSEIVLLKALLYWSLGTMFLAFIPSFLASLGERVGAPWRIAHAVFALFHTWVFVWYFRQVKVFANTSWFVRVAVPVGLSVLAVQILVAVGFFEAVAESLYLLGLLWFLFSAASCFVFLLFPADQPPPPT